MDRTVCRIALTTMGLLNMQNPQRVKGTMEHDFTENQDFPNGPVQDENN